MMAVPSVIRQRYRSGGYCLWHITGGRNLARVSTVVTRKCHPGIFDIVHVKDSQGHEFATRLTNVFCKGNKPYILLPKGKGVKLSISEERDEPLAAKMH